MSEPNADSVRLTANQRAVLDYLANHGGIASTGDLVMAATMEGWTFHPRSVVANLARRGLVRERYHAFLNLTKWEQVDSSEAQDG